MDWNIDLKTLKTLKIQTLLCSWFLSIEAESVANKEMFPTFICRNIISNANTQMIKDQIKFYCIIQFVTFGWKLPDIKFSSDLIKFHFIYILEAKLE